MSRSPIYLQPDHVRRRRRSKNRLAMLCSGLLLFGESGWLGESLVADGRSGESNDRLT